MLHVIALAIAAIMAVLYLIVFVMLVIAAIRYGLRCLWRALSWSGGLAYTNQFQLPSQKS